MWKIGPECAAQQRKKVIASTMNCGDRNASPAEIDGSSTPAPLPTTFGEAGARRTKRAAGIRSDQATMPITIIAVRQSYVEISQRANGEMVIGATPIPAETSDTARERLSSNQSVAAAIMGAKNAPAARPTIRP